MAEVQVNALAIGDAVRAKALSYAAKTGTAIDLVVVKAADSKHEYSLAPIALYRAIKENLTEDEIDALPLPGQHWRDKDGTIHNNPDIAQWKDPSKPDSKAKEISFYILWSDGTPEGARVVEELDWCSRAADPKMSKEGIDAKWLAKYASNPQLIKKRKKYLEGRRGTVRKAYKDAIRLLWQLDMVNELVIYDPNDKTKIVGGCMAELDDDGDENTVLVSDRAAPKRNWKLYSVGAFLKLNPKKALEAGGSFTALEATAERGPQTPQTPKTGLALHSVQTPETSDKVAVVWHSYLDKCMKDKSGADYAALLKHLTSDSGRQAVLTMGGIRKMLNDLFKMDTIQSIYDIGIEKLNKAA